MPKGSWVNIAYTSDRASWFAYDGTKDSAPVSMGINGVPVGLAVLSASRAILAYTDSDDTNKLKCKLLNTSGTSVTVLSTLTVSSSNHSGANGMEADIATIDSQYAVIGSNLDNKLWVINTASDTLALVDATGTTITSIGTNNLIAISDVVNGTGNLLLAVSNATNAQLNVRAITPNTGTGLTTLGTAVNATNGAPVTNTKPVFSHLSSGDMLLMHNGASAGWVSARINLSGTTVTYNSEVGLPQATLNLQPCLRKIAADTGLTTSGQLNATQMFRQQVENSGGTLSNASGSGWGSLYSGNYEYIETLGTTKYCLMRPVMDFDTPDSDRILTVRAFKITDTDDKDITYAPTIKRFSSTKVANDAITGSGNSMKKVSTSKVIFGYQDSFSGNLLKVATFNL